MPPPICPSIRKGSPGSDGICAFVCICRELFAPLPPPAHIAESRASEPSVAISVRVMTFAFISSNGSPRVGEPGKKARRISCGGGKACYGGEMGPFLRFGRRESKSYRLGIADRPGKELLSV